MTEINPAIQARIELVKPLVAELLAERGMSAPTKTNNYLPVFLGLRPLALTYLPAEMPGGQRMGAAIDEYYKEHYTPGAGARLNLLDRLRKRGVNQEQEAELLARRKVLDNAYDEIVAASPAYVAHLAWLDRLALQQWQVKRRPSLREMYIYRDRPVRDQLAKLEDVAEKARQRMAAAGQGRPEQWMEYVYANEFDVEYLKGLGTLLGYPQCCIDRYTEDRNKAVNVEQRAWEQVRDLQSEGISIDVHAYYVKDFFPCTPDCPAARAQGELWEATMAALGPEIRDLYVGAMYSSFELVQNYPAMIQQHQQRLEQGPPA
jgi:hypothetical protein